MNRVIALLLAFVLAALATVVQAAGTGMPMMKGLKDPGVLADLVEASFAKDKAGKVVLSPTMCKHNGSCATAHDYFDGIRREHPKSNLENIADLPRYLRSLVKQPAPEGEWYMSRLLVNGERRTYDHMAWHRAFFKGEEVWDDPNTGEHILAGFCENVIGAQKSPVAEKEFPVKKRDIVTAVEEQSFAPATRVIASCPAYHFLWIHIWEKKALYLPGVEATHTKEVLGQKQFAGVPHVSKTHGRQFLKATAAGDLSSSVTTHAIRVSLIKTPEASGGDQSVTTFEILGDIDVTGFYKLQFRRDVLEQWDAIRLVVIDGDVLSPPIFVKTGFQELRFFNHLPNTKLGEWDSNPDPDCLMRVHFIDMH